MLKTLKHNYRETDLSEFDEDAQKSSNSTLMELIEPRFLLDNFICDDVFRLVLDDTLFYANHYKEIQKLMPIKSVTKSCLLNFFGNSGTGKTMVAEAIAKELGKKLYIMNYANVESSLLGKTPKNITDAFRGIDASNAIIMLDEADSFVSRRISELRQGAEYALNMARGQIINEIDKFEGVIILATNLFGTYDNAVLRRIKFNIFFDMPTTPAKEEMFLRFLPKSHISSSVVFDKLALLADGLSGGDIYNICEIAVMKSLQRISSNQDPCGQDEIETIIEFYKRKAQHRKLQTPSESGAQQDVATPLETK